jgi:hypothetical protein
MRLTGHASVNHDYPESLVLCEIMRAFESTKWPAARFIPCPPKDDDQYRYQDHQLVVKVEFKRRVKPLKAHELIDQNHPLFIVTFLGHEAHHENGEVGNRAQ